MSLVLRLVFRLFSLGEGVAKKGFCFWDNSKIDYSIFCFTMHGLAYKCLTELMLKDLLVKTNAVAIKTTLEGVGEGGKRIWVLLTQIYVDEVKSNLNTFIKQRAFSYSKYSINIKEA